MKRYLWISILIAAAMLIGCATTGGQAEFYTAQQSFLLAQSAQVQRPLFEMRAVAGTSIQNLESIMVYLPPTGQAKDFKQYISAPHPGWELAGTFIRTAGTVAGVYFIADGIKSIFNSVTGNAGTSYTQAISGKGNTGDIRTMGDMTTGRIGDGSTVGGILDQTSTPTIVRPEIVVTPPPEVVIVEPPAPIIVPVPAP